MKKLFVLLLFFAKSIVIADSFDDLDIKSIPVGSTVTFLQDLIIEANESSVTLAEHCSLNFKAVGKIRKLSTDHSLKIKSVKFSLRPTNHIWCDNFSYYIDSIDSPSYDADRCDWKNYDRKVYAIDVSVQKNKQDVSAATMICEDWSTLSVKEIREAMKERKINLNLSTTTVDDF